MKVSPSFKSVSRSGGHGKIIGKMIFEPHTRGVGTGNTRGAAKWQSTGVHGMYGERERVNTQSATSGAADRGLLSDSVNTESIRSRSYTT